MCVYPPLKLFRWSLIDVTPSPHPSLRPLIDLNICLMRVSLRFPVIAVVFCLLLLLYSLVHSHDFSLQPSPLVPPR